MKIQVTEINFPNGKKAKVYHNLPELGLNILNAIPNFLIRTKDASEENFINYIKSKDVNIIAINEERFNEIMK